MFKALIVDDENLVLQSLQEIIRKNFPAIDLIEVANTGLEAIELSDKIRPDIVFMDIMIPGINGLEAIKEIKKRNSHVSFVVISAYDQFEYAQKAIELGVLDYVLKPFNKRVIMEVIQKVIITLSDINQKQKIELINKEKIERALPIIEQQFFYSMIFGLNSNISNSIYDQLLPFDINHGYVISIELIYEIVDSIESADYYINFAEGFKIFIKNKLPCIAASLLSNRIILYVSSEKNIDETVNTIIKYFAKYANRNIFYKIGIGRPKASQNKLYESYEESLYALKKAPENCANYYSDGITRDNIASYPYNLEGAFFCQIRDACEKKSLQVLNEIVAFMQPNSFENIKISLLQLVVPMLKSTIDSGEIKQDVVHNVQEEINAYLKIPSLDLLIIWFSLKVKLLCELTEKKRSERINSVFNSVKEFVELNYMNDIKLEDAAEIVFLSPAYFSGLFHKKTGQSFIDYLTYVRIERAKELIKKSTVSFKEISSMVGYKNQNYFCHVFKKTTGLSPSEFKEMIKSV